MTILILLLAITPLAQVNIFKYIFSKNMYSYMILIDFMSLSVYTLQVTAVIVLHFMNPIYMDLYIDKKKVEKSGKL